MWIFNGKTFTTQMIGNNVGFVYLITNTETNKKYIGKKLFKFTRTKKRKNKRSVKVLKDSDWQSYYGSNEDLKNDVARLGPEKFTRTILNLCENKGTCNYLEAKYQFQYGVLESDNWYNNWITCKISRSHVKFP